MEKFGHVINPLTPGVFPKKLIFKTFLTFRGLESAEIAPNQSKWPWKRRARPCISLEAHLTTFFAQACAKVKVLEIVFGR